MFTGTRNYYKIKIASQYNCYRNQNNEQLLGDPRVHDATRTEMASAIYETLDNCRLTEKRNTYIIFRSTTISAKL